MKNRLYGFSTLIVINLIGLALIGAMTIARTQPQGYMSTPNSVIYPPIVTDSWVPGWGGGAVAIGGGSYGNMVPVGPVPNYNQNNNQPHVLPQTTGRVVLLRDNTNNRIVATWEGDAHAVRRILVATIDKNKHTLERKTITSLPAKATLAKTSKVAAAGVYIEYVNGAATTFLVTTF